MAWSSEAIIATVGVLINVPAFCLIVWQMCRKKHASTNNPYRSLEDGGPGPLSAPQHLAFATEYAVALPLVNINMTREAGRQ